MRFSDFSDGLWNAEGRDFGVPPNALLTADNLEYDTATGVKGRRGTSIFATLASPIISLWRHYPRTGTPSTLVAEDNGATVFFVSASGSSNSFSAVAGTGSGLATGKPWYFQNWASQNKSFLTNGSDGMRSWDGTTIATIASAGGAGNLNPVPNGPYIAQHKARLWATLSTELNFSVYASEVNDPTTWPAANQISVNDPRGGLITGLASYFDNLIVLKNSSLWQFVGDIETLTGAQLARYCDIGCVAPNTVAISDFGVIFLGKDGLYLTDGIQPNPVELSYPIRPLFVSRGTETQFNTAVGTWYPRKKMYVLKLNPAATDAYVLQYLQVLSEDPYIGQHSRPVFLWSHHTALAANAGTTMNAWYSAQDDGRLLTGDASGNLWIVDADNVATDNGTPYTCKIQTAARPVSQDERTGRVYGAKVLYRGSVPLSGAIRYDAHQSDDSTFTVGNTVSIAEQWSRARLFDFAKMGRLVSASFANATDGYGFELHSIDLDIRYRSPRVWRDFN